MHECVALIDARAEHEHERDIKLAWWVGRLHHADPKKYPSLRELLKGRGRRQTPEEMMANLRLLTSTKPPPPEKI